MEQQGEKRKREDPPVEQSTAETSKKARSDDEFLIQWEEVWKITDHDLGPERTFGTDVKAPGYHLDEEVPLEEAEGGFILLKQCQAHQDQMTPINNKQREVIVAALAKTTPQMGGISVDRVDVFQTTTASGTRYEIAYVRDGSDDLELFLLVSAEPQDVGAPETSNTQISPRPYLVVGCWRGHTYLATREFLYESSEDSGPSCLIIKDKLPDDEAEADQEEDGEEQRPNKVVLTPQHLIDCATHYYTKMREHVHYA